MSQVIWTVDAGQVKIEDHLDNFPLFRNELVNEFLDRDDKFILLGPKGVGKTLLLKLKSLDLRKKGYRCYPSNQLIEIVMRGSVSFDKDDLLQYQSADQWKVIWRIALTTLAIRALGVTIPEYKGPFPFNDLPGQIDPILTQLLRSRERLPEIDSTFSRLIAPKFQNIEVDFAAFLDRLDETLGKHTGATLARYEQDEYKGDGHLSYNVWKAAQYGLMEAVRELREKNNRIRFYVTCRHEAFRPEDSATAHNVSAICVDLRYSHRELKQMFELKLYALKRISAQSFVQGQKAGDIHAEFFGFASYTHPRVKKIDGTPVVEHIADCLIRHTRGSPREIEDLAREIGSIPANVRNVDNVRAKINEKSNDFLDYAQGQALPYWDRTVDEFVKKLPSNSISRKYRLRTSASYRRQFPKAEDPFRFLFRHGLLGYARRDEDTGVSVQRFAVNDPDLPALEQELEAASQLFLHPCLDIRVQGSNPNYLRDEINVIGHGKAYEAITPIRHLHFGAGKIGCGLIVPILKQRAHVSLCLVQRPSSRWKPLELPRATAIDIEVNDESGSRRYSFTVVSDSIPFERAKRYINEWHRGERDIILLTAQSERIQHALKSIHSISTSVRQEPIRDIATEIATANRGRPVVVFPFENDEACFSTFRDEFRGFPRITVASVVLDRLCTDQHISSTAIYVSTERYAAVHIHAPRVLHKLETILRIATAINSKAPPEVSREEPILATVESDEDFTFLHEAKRKLVNATHAAAAVCAYYELTRSGHPVHPAVWGSYIFQIIARDPDIREIITPIANFFALRALKEYREAVKRKGKNGTKNLGDDELYLRACYLKELYAVSWQRMRHMPDSISRILPPDIKKFAKKYELFFGKIGQREIRTTFGDFADLKILGIDVDEAMVQNATAQLEERFGRVLKYLVQLQP